MADNVGPEIVRKKGKRRIVDGRAKFNEAEWLRD